MPSELSCSLFVILGICLLMGIILLSIRNNKLRHLLHTDFLCGISNMPALLTYWEKKRKNWVNEKVKVNLVLLDIDNFHQYNLQGYDSGDAVLIEFTENLVQLLPATVFLARYKLGDEFILVGEMSEPEIIRLLETIQNSISSLGSGRAISFSYGLSGEDGTYVLKTYLMQAEKKLRISKENRKIGSL